MKRSTAIWLTFTGLANQRRVLLVIRSAVSPMIVPEAVGRSRSAIIASQCDTFADIFGTNGAALRSAQCYASLSNLGSHDVKIASRSKKQLSLLRPDAMKLIKLLPGMPPIRTSSKLDYDALIYQA